MVFGSKVYALPYFDNVSFYTEHNLTFPDTWSYQFGAFVYDDNYDINSVVAREVTTGQEFVLSDLTTITGEWIWGSAGISGTPYLDQLEIIATNTNGETNSVFTHVLDSEFPVDIVQNVGISDDSLTPTFSWDPVVEAQRYRVRIQDEFGNRIFDSVLEPDGIFEETFYTLPLSILEYDTPYIARIIAQNYGDDGDGIYNLENRSSSYLNFHTGIAPVPEPTTMLLFGTGIASLAVIRRKRK